jgi:hypothetical protein
MLQGRDGIGACPCCGTSVVFRRDSLISLVHVPVTFCHAAGPMLQGRDGIGACPLLAHRRRIPSRCAHLTHACILLFVMP